MNHLLFSFSETVTFTSQWEQAPQEQELQRLWKGLWLHLLTDTAH